eukprot:gene59073-80893_t
MTIRQGGCLCGAVRYEVEGEPLRVGLCHCLDCRKESGAVFSCFAVFPAASFRQTGEVRTHSGRSFCPSCGSRLFNPSDQEVEIRFGTLDAAPGDLVPQYEIWVKQREAWL